MSVGIEITTTIQYIRQLAYELFGGAETAPSKIQSVIGSLHRSANRCVAEEGSSTPGAGFIAIEIHREDEFTGTGVVVVRQEQIAVIGSQGVSGYGSHLVAISDAIAVLGRTGVYFRIQIQTAQQGPGSSFVGTAIFIGTCILQFCLDGLQLILDIGEEIGTADLRRQKRTHVVPFRYKGNVSEQIQRMVVTQRPQEASFRAHITDLRGIGSREITLSQFSRCTLANELVGQRDLEENAAIEGADKHVGRAPRQAVEILDGGIVPTNHRFVSSQLLSRPILADVAGETFVDTGDIALSVRTTVTRQGQARIDFGQHGTISVQIHI